MANPNNASVSIHVETKVQEPQTQPESALEIVSVLFQAIQFFSILVTMGVFWFCFMMILGRYGYLIKK